MVAILEVDASLTDRYQTTVPEPVRKALGLRKRDRIRFELTSEGDVLLRRVEDEKRDPVVAAFLQFLQNDIPLSARAPSEDLVARIQALVVGAEVNLDVALPDDEE